MQRAGFLSLQLWRQAGVQSQQLRCVGSASKLFPDPSALQSAKWQADNSEIGKVSGMPIEALGRMVRSLSPGEHIHVHRCDLDCLKRAETAKMCLLHT